ncbi:site-specific integrase [Dehalococcoides sp. HCBD]|uniref:site-specific integrase n=1 Tax=Dehalococcoides sp. HCBD TaxID=3440628 RepID=UPI003F5C0D97
MDELHNIQTAIEAVLKGLEEQSYSPYTINIQQGVLNRLVQFIKANGFNKLDETVCMDFIRSRTGTNMQGFFGTGDRKTNAFMKPIQNLLAFVKTGSVFYQMRPQKPSFQCPKSFEEEYLLFQNECEERHYAKATIISNNQILHKFLLYLELNNVCTSEDIKPPHLTGFLSNYDKAKPKYVATILYILRNYLSFLYQQGFIEHNVAASLPKSKIMRNAFIPYSWKTEDVKKLLKAVDRGTPKGKRDYAILLLIVHLGLRVSDIRGLKLSSLNWNRRTIILTMQKTKQPLELPLLDDIGWAIIDYLKNGRPETQCDRVFVRHRAPFDSFGENESFYRELHRYMIKAGLNTPVDVHCGMHSLRSTLARNMLEAKAPLPVISQVLGHQNINTTSIYLKIDINGLKKCTLDPEEVFTNEGTVPMEK